MTTLQAASIVLECPVSGSGTRATADSDGNEYLYGVDEAGCATVVRCRANAPVVVVPCMLGGYPVTAIGDEAFATSVKLGAGLRPAASRHAARQAASLSGLVGNKCNNSVQRVVLRSGVTSIGRGAFRGCARLVDVTLPESLESIGDHAFSASGVRSIRLPGRCVHLSEYALRTGPSCLPECNPAYRSKVEYLDVEGGNSVYCMRGDVLCRRLVSGGLEAVLCPGKAKSVDLRGDIVGVSSQAFAGTFEIGELAIRESLQVDSPAGLLPNGACSQLTIELDESFGNGRTVSVHVPDTLFGHPMFRALCRDGRIDVASFLMEYDRALLGLDDAFERCQLMLARLADPLFLADAIAQGFSSLVSGSFDNLCAHIGARGMWRLFDLLADTGILSAGTIGHAIGVLSAVSDSAAIAYLLQLKQTRFAEDSWDYAL